MNKDKINKEKKEKAKKIAFKILHGVSYALSTFFIATCIVACASSSSKKSDNSPKSLIQYRIDGESESQSESESVSYPIYDDDDYIITLSEYQVNNYHFDNLANLYNSFNDSDFANTFTYNYDNHSLELLEYTQNDNISYSDEYYALNISLASDINYGLFILNDLSTNQDIQFEDILIIETDNLSYSQFKQAIQLDIQSNEPSDESPTSDIFTAISDTISNFVIALNSGITAIVGLFWNSTSSALTPLGVLTTIVVGVALAYFVFRLIIGLIRLRG